MSPDIEITFSSGTTNAWFPPGVSTAQLEGVFKDLGGKVTEWKRKPGERIPAGVVTLDNLKDFLWWGQPFFKGVEGRGDITMFETLRTNLSFEEQERLMVQFFTQEVDGFPNGEKIARFVTQASRVNCEESQRAPSEDLLLGYVREYIERSNPFSEEDRRSSFPEFSISLDRVSLKIIKDFNLLHQLYKVNSQILPWEHWNYPGDLIHELLRSTKRKAARETACEVAYATPWNTLEFKGIEYHDTEQRAGGAGSFFGSRMDGFGRRNEPVGFQG